MDYKDEKPFVGLYEDSSVIVLSKAHGIHTVADRYGNAESPLINLLKNSYGHEILPVHRLDAGTGGIMVFAKNKNAHANLCVQFQNRETVKVYLAIVRGILSPVTVMLPIGKGNHGKFKINFRSGKRAVSTFYPLSSNGNATAAVAIPVTGRTHQLRIHLKACKTPLYQDWLYSSPNDDRRLTLFASYISFAHPLSGEKMKFTAPVSDFMKSKLDLFGLSIKNVLSNFYASY